MKLEIPYCIYFSFFLHIGEYPEIIFAYKAKTPKDTKLSKSLLVIVLDPLSIRNGMDKAKKSFHSTVPLNHLYFSMFFNCSKVPLKSDDIPLLSLAICTFISFPLVINYAAIATDLGLFIVRVRLCVCVLVFN